MEILTNNWQTIVTVLGSLLAGGAGLSGYQRLRPPKPTPSSVRERLIQDAKDFRSLAIETETDPIKQSVENLCLLITVHEMEAK